MGWLFMQSLGEHSPRSYLDNQFTVSRDGMRQTVLASALVAMKTYYAAVELACPGEEARIFAIVCLVKFNPRASDGYVFGYKDMSENMGPNEARCPASILDLLTPTDNEHAIDWRRRCRDAIAVRAAQNARLSPKAGQSIIFDPPLELSDGRTIGRFEVIPNPRGRGVRYLIPGTSTTVRIPAVKQRNYSLIKPAVIG